MLKPHEFEQILGDSKGQESLACCSPRGCKVDSVTEQQQEKPQHLLYGNEEVRLGPADPTPDSGLMEGMLVIPCWFLQHSPQHLGAVGQAAWTWPSHPFCLQLSFSLWLGGPGVMVSAEDVSNLSDAQGSLGGRHYFTRPAAPWVLQTFCACFAHRCV